MSHKYYYIKENILNNYYRRSGFSWSDFFLGLRAGFLFMIVIFLGYFFVREPTVSVKIHSPLGSTFVVEAVNSPVETNVLGDKATVVQELSPTPTPTAALQPTSAPVAEPAVKTAKNSYSIAIIGDSMVDTMGERLEYLEHALKRKYPNTNFSLYNFGQGAQNVSEGLSRLHNRFDYQDRHFPSLDEIKPDVLIVGSFAYNPFSPHDRDRYSSTLTQFVEQAKTISPRVYLLAEIAPLKVNFGKGPNGVNWDDNTAYQHATNIIDQLEGAIGVSHSLNIPLINAFTPSQVAADKSGNPQYVNSSDGIHPSVAGHEFMANLIAETIRLD